MYNKDRPVKNPLDTQYKALLKKLLEEPVRPTRTGEPSKSTFVEVIRHDLRDGFPLLTTKNVHFKSIAGELLWFLSGDTNVHALNDMGVTIWNEWASEDGNLGPIYGKQWRNFGGIDQITQVFEQLRDNPYSRRHLVSAWNVPEINDMALPPCHYGFQFYVSDIPTGERISMADSVISTNVASVDDKAVLDALAGLGIPEKRLSIKVVQRSADTFLGVPFNLASYALLVHMFADQLGYEPGELVWIGGDVHLYNNHTEQALEQLTRDARYLPELRIKPGVKSLFDYTLGDFEIVGYNPHPAIKAPVAV